MNGTGIETMSVPATRRISAQEYLDSERVAEIRSEYLDGLIQAMAGGSRDHSRIASNIIQFLGSKLHNGPCQVFTSDLRVYSQATNSYVYPDVTVVCDEPQITDNDILLNPTVVFEVSSESTIGYDHGLKSWIYRNIPSLKAYFIVDQFEYRIDSHLRAGINNWTIGDVKGYDLVLELPMLDVSLPFSEVYYRVEFAKEKS